MWYSEKEQRQFSAGFARAASRKNRRFCLEFFYGHHNPGFPGHMPWQLGSDHFAGHPRASGSPTSLQTPGFLQANGSGSIGDGVGVGVTVPPGTNPGAITVVPVAKQ